MSAPSVPPRPSRSQNTANMEVPKVPPRPKRSMERSASPKRDSFAPSPLNDPNYLHKGFGNKSEEHIPSRPPSVTLPSIGQEGSEYDSIQNYIQTEAPELTKNVGDLPLHAPRASVPTSQARSRIQAVTRTDFSHAVTAGISKPVSDDKAARPESNRSESSMGRASRPQSLYKDDEEHGIPEIGMQVPMYPNAGDVQAPTPSPHAQGFASGGIAGAGRAHARTKSREAFHAPPGSYGLHGHGIISEDALEKKWYEKHPEDLAREKQGEYGPAVSEARKDYHWMKDDLAKLVHETASKGLGMGSSLMLQCLSRSDLSAGTSNEVIGTPDEQIGYLAHEEYTARLQSRPESTQIEGAKSSTGGVSESPLRLSSISAAEAQEQQSDDPSAENDVIHIDPPVSRSDLGSQPTSEGGSLAAEHGYSVPVLASDEVAKHPEAEFLQPAVPPEVDHRFGVENTASEEASVLSPVASRRGGSRSSSRNNNRPGSTLQRLASASESERINTPLEDVKEYEPLFPDEDTNPGPWKPSTDKLKRPDLARHHFPSRDVWEDTPESLQYTTTVETPEPPRAKESATSDVAPETVFEKPEDEQARKEQAEEDQKSFLPDHARHFAKAPFKHDVLDDIPGRPSMHPRFPSQDIWEDTPESHHLVTTVSAPQTEDTGEYADDPPAAEQVVTSERPSIPARPRKDKEPMTTEKTGPPTTEKSKPQVPARPAKPFSRSSQKVPTTSTSSAESQKPEPPQPKSKPAVPARPSGGKIAALQSSFLKDLNSKLGIGPQAPKIKEPEPETELDPKEAQPLRDARKGRAKGPQRRKPASSPSPAAAGAPAVAEPSLPTQRQRLLEVAPATMIWGIDAEGNLDVPAARMGDAIVAALDGQTEAQDKGQDDVAKEEAADKTARGAEEAEAKTAASEGSEETKGQSEHKGDEEEDDVVVLDKAEGSPSISAEDKEDSPAVEVATGEMMVGPGNEAEKTV